MGADITGSAMFSKRRLAGGLALCLVGLAAPASGADCTVQFNSRLQRMSGFGGSTAWKSGLADSLITRLFSPTEGCGLSLVRMRIAPNATTGSGEIAIAKKAQALGAAIWAAPWSPPANYKDNNNVNNGGNLLPARYQDWADDLADYAKNLAGQGIDLKWISAQNEPNWTADYESCRYTPEQITAFIGENLGPSLAKAGLKTRVIGPEVINFGSLKPFGDALLNNANALKYLDVIATHQYGDNPKAPNFPYALVATKGKELWETEHGHDQFAGDESMTPGIYLAKEMHTDITLGPVSAYHVWWIIPADGVTGTASNGLVMKGRVIQRGYVMGNYSRFVRPGSFRVTATDNPATGVFVTAYRNDSLGRLIVVAINENAAATSQKFVFDGVTVPTVTPWETSEAVKLTAREPVSAGAGFTWTLPGKSVVSFVGSYSAGTGAVARPAVPRPYRDLALGRDALTATFREAGDYALAVYSLDGALIGSQSGRGPGKIRVPLRPGQAGLYLVKVSLAGGRTFEEKVKRQD